MPSEPAVSADGAGPADPAVAPAAEAASGPSPPPAPPPRGAHEPVALLDTKALADQAAGQRRIEAAQEAIRARAEETRALAAENAALRAHLREQAEKTRLDNSIDDVKGAIARTEFAAAAAKNRADRARALRQQNAINQQRVKAAASRTSSTRPLSAKAASGGGSASARPRRVGTTTLPTQIVQRQQFHPESPFHARAAESIRNELSLVRYNRNDDTPRADEQLQATIQRQRYSESHSRHTTSSTPAVSAEMPASTRSHTSTVGAKPAEGYGDGAAEGGADEEAEVKKLRELFKSPRFDTKVEPRFAGDGASRFNNIQDPDYRKLENSARTAGRSRALALPDIGCICSVQ